MPVKRRQPKRRISPEAEAAAWGDLFGCGHDFFGDLEDFGFPGGDADRAARRAARDAWRRFGTTFMRTWSGVTPPWAFLEFGAPRCQ
jgi:hypothetical protein